MKKFTYRQKLRLYFFQHKRVLIIIFAFLAAAAITLYPLSDFFFEGGSQENILGSPLLIFSSGSLLVFCILLLND
ncbi:hypothetical protein [Aliikangiella sp. G2MR2-5]|uniref:hypothetical protein n=1 Tax=Aliikangiella sp. G2MR2-5 TaxID=2788943 RepID=UPI0018AA5E56|nr:hypothetical protein [Aliikangiella sp. G2MR2-5]